MNWKQLEEELDDDEDDDELETVDESPLKFDVEFLEVSSNHELVFTSSIAAVFFAILRHDS